MSYAVHRWTEEAISLLLAVAEYSVEPRRLLS